MHLEKTEEIDFRGHHSRGQYHVDGAKLELLQHFLVAAQLAGAKHHDLVFITQFGISAFGELVGTNLEQRARITDVTQLQLDLSVGNAWRPRSDEHTSELQ